MNTTPPTVFIIDDDDAVRAAMKSLLASVGLNAETYASAPLFLAGYHPTPVGCVVVDVRLPGMSGLELQGLLRDRAIDLPVIMMSGHSDVASAVRAMKAGAVDFLQKPINAQVLIEAVQRAVQESLVIAEAQVKVQRTRALLATLSGRERDVLDGVVGGEPNKRIATRLNIAEKTVEAHRARVMAKLEVKNVVELMKTVLTSGCAGKP